MYDESTPVINPDPTKYAFCEEGIQRLPRQCKSCYCLFTPVNDSQVECCDCKQNYHVIPIKFKMPEKNSATHYRKKDFVPSNPEELAKYCSYHSRCRSKIRTAVKKNDVKSVEKWEEVRTIIKETYKSRIPLNYESIVNEVFNKH